MKTWQERFWRKVNKLNPNDCWPWAGAKDREGRGMLWRDGVTKTAPRLAMEIHLGQNIEPGKDVCHSCDNPNCVNPAHLWIGSHQENMLDSGAKGRAHYSKNSCKRGHPLEGYNVYINPVGARVCKECRKANHRERYRRLTSQKHL